MAKLWAKSGSKLHPLVEAYTVGDDYLLDQILMPYDILGTAAHLKGLQEIGILKKDELRKLLNQLKKLEKEFKKGKVKIRIQDEDCHTVIENFVSKRYKSLGGKVHTGRSRNDQVLTAIRLYMKDQLNQIRKQALKLAKDFLDFAQDNKHIPLPGYTHTQQAMLSSVGHYFCAYLESLIDDISLLDSTYHHINKNPLGSAAGYGVSLLLDRDLTRKEMGFKEIQINSLYCQNSRGKFESLYLEALTQVMMTLGRFASDLILFTSKEFDFFKIKNNLVTGSSIMPQKRNLDAMEILRANVHVLSSNQLLVKDICKNLISGYHRDLQLIKKPILESSKIVLQSLEIVQLYLQGIEPKQESISAKISKDIFMADLATELASKKKIPFRLAYKRAFKEISKYYIQGTKPSQKTKNPKTTAKYQINLQDNIQSKTSLGAPGNLDLNHYKNLLFEKNTRKAKK